MRTGFYPGSFDPITNGHVDVIKRGLRLVDRLLVGIGVSATKKPFLTFERRAAMIETEIRPLAESAGAELEVIEFDGLLVDVARQHGASIVLRGLRTAADFDYEAQMVAMNRTMAPEVETVFLAASPEVGFISSTLVRQIFGMGGDIAPFVPQAVLRELENMDGGKK